MRVADYVMKTIKEHGVEHVFTLVGGGAMYLVDALGRSGMKAVCCHHEQAASIAAQGYAMARNGLGACLVTTGPGGTNALTALGAAYMDSTPVLFISGQVKTADFASIRGVRQYGAQENDIVSMAKPVSKYAITVTKAEDIRYHMEKAIYLSTNGRKGPVWIDIPQDIQNEDVDVSSLRAFDKEEIENEAYQVHEEANNNLASACVKELIEDLKISRKPVILVGHGVKASKSTKLLRELVRKLRIPVLVTWREYDFLDNDDELFFGAPGLQAVRSANLLTQNADLMVVLGSRLDNMITAFGESRFGLKAKKYIVDIDENELKKYTMNDAKLINADVRVFLEELKANVETKELPSYEEWINVGRRIKERFPLLKEKQAFESEKVDLYKLTMAVSEECNKDDIIVVSSTSRCNTAGHMAFKHKEEQITVSSMGYGSMGFALPSVVGAGFAKENPRVIMFEGDGSLQLNIQELQTILYNRINAKLFIFTNHGYAAIATMQDRNFEGFHVGSDMGSGLTMPSTEKIANAYGYHYVSITNDSEIKTKVKEAMETDGPVICEFFGDIRFDEIPKCISFLNEEGKRVSASLENPFPFLSEDEMKEIEEIMEI